MNVFMTSALAGGEWSASRQGRFTTEERAPSSQWIGGWVGPSAGLDEVKRRKILLIPGLEIRHLGRPAHSQSLYRLRYPCSSYMHTYIHTLTCHRLKRGFGLVNRFIGSSLVVTTDNGNTFKITVIITHTLSLHRSSIYFSHKHSALIFAGL
jgi:hypothetical protein